jgi:RHS repeat-associated protein
VETQYDGDGIAYSNSYGNVTVVKRYGGGATYPPSGTPVSTTTTSYANIASTTCGPAVYIHDHPCSTATTGSAGTLSQTNYIYNSFGHETSKSTLVAGSTYLSSSATYNPNGTIASSTDVNNKPTYFYYNGTGGCNNLLLTSTLLPVDGLSSSQTWSCTGGVLTSTTGADGGLTSYGYVDQNGKPDGLWRLLSTTDPLNNTTWNTYSPSGTSPMTLETAMTFNGGASAVDKLTTFDGLGRPILLQTREAPGSGNFDTVSIGYDADGRAASKGIPCVSTASVACSSATTVTSYDALNRTLQVTDGGTGYTSYKYTPGGSYLDVLVTQGPAPAGENTKRRQLEYDGLGRLTSVCEITSTLNGAGNCAQNTAQTGYWTKYTYDGLSRLTNVSQNAQGTTQARRYVYDDLSRLTSETNPENGINPVPNGTKSYTYDSDSTCGTSNGDLVKRVDAVGNVTCYAYDGMHRNTKISYPSGPYSAVTPTKYFVYDAATVDGQNMGYVNGRLAEAYTGSPTSKTTDIGFTYSPRGEVKSTWESTPHSGGFYQPTAAYWANGSLQNLWISQIPDISYRVDGEGRMFTVSASSGQNPVTNASYNPASQATGVTFGSGDSDAFTFDPNTGRMKQYKYSVNGQAEIGNLGWNANGTLGTLGITDPINAGDTQNCTYGYDDLTRIGSANCGSVWGQTFAYDAFGNIDKAVTTTGIAWQPTYNIKNQYQSLPGFTPSYDADGNLLADSFHNYTWDAEGKVSAIDSIAFTYDALRRNVEQNRSGTYYQVVYSPLGAKLGMFIGQTLQESFVPLPGGTQAEYMSWGLSDYRHPDWLGSDRLESTTSHAIVSAAAYAPFGEPYAESGSYGDLSFTGANKDTLWLDYDFLYREYDPKQGRWISPDPAGLRAVDPTNPQSWNRYAYVLNNPLSNTDPTGLDCVYVNDNNNGIENIDQQSNNSECQQNGGYWVDGGVQNFFINSDTGEVWLQGTTDGLNTTSAYYSGQAANNDPCANTTLSATGVNIRQNIAAANLAVSSGYAAGSIIPFGPSNPIGGLIGALYSYDQLVHTGGPQDVKNQLGPGTPQQRVDAGNISFGVTCPFGGPFCQFAAGVAQTSSGYPNPNGTLLTGFDTPSDNAGIRVGQAMRAAGCHE